MSTYFKFQTHRWHVKSICTGERARIAPQSCIPCIFHALRTAHMWSNGQHLQELVVLSGTEGFRSVAIEGTTSLHLVAYVTSRQGGFGGFNVQGQGIFLQQTKKFKLVHRGFIHLKKKRMKKKSVRYSAI